MPNVRKNEAANRYEVLLDDGTVAGFADYVVDGNKVVLPHTVVQPQYGGQGLAGLLAQAALEDIAAANRCVVPACSFIAVYIERKPQWQTLVCPI